MKLCHLHVLSVQFLLPRAVVPRVAVEPLTCPWLSPADGRHGIVRVDRVPLAAKLVDLPCIIESLKTIDKKTFYKTADICQV